MQRQPYRCLILYRGKNFSDSDPNSQHTVYARSHSYRETLYNNYAIEGLPYMVYNYYGTQRKEEGINNSY